MVEETFMLDVEPGTEAAFEQDFRKVVQILKNAKGFLGAELKRSIEQENRFLVAIAWNSVEEHTEEFKKTAAFEQMKAILLPHYLETPNIQHYKKIV